VLLCAFWRWGAVLHVNIIVAIGIKRASGKMKEIAIFELVSNQIIPIPCDGRIQLAGCVECVCLLLQDLLQSCSRGGGGTVEDMCYERVRAEACVD
jgi:hypothetical protein